MIYALPGNIIPFFVLGVSITLFGVRGLYLYSKQKTPLIFYYGIGALLGGISALTYSVPFIFTHNELNLKAITIVGDLLYYFTIIVMARIIWYLGFNKRIAFGWVVTPYIITILGAMLATAYYWSSLHYTFLASSVDYPVPLVASWFFAAMSTAFVFVGFLTLQQARSIKSSKQRVRLFLIGSAFLLGGIAAISNFLLTQGSNTKAFSTIGYVVVALVLFAGIFLISRKKT